MSELTAAHFADFVKQVHGHDPFPWQQRLVERICEEGRWPDVLDVPTGLGKTSVIDIAVFVAAVRPELARRRLFFVVDRRLIVDEAYDHAQKLARALIESSGDESEQADRSSIDVVEQVGRALLQRGDDVPLQVARMRGGVTWSWRWLERPDRFAVVVGTVDQIGSRLLFRGYGVGEHLRPIDAALVGTDSLIVLDEAPLAEPFRRTVRTIQRLNGDERGPKLLTMSATVPEEPDAVVHGIGPEDEAHDEAGRRLRAQRRLYLLQPKAGKKNAATVVPAVMASWAQALAGPEDSGRVVGVICNTVARARTVFDQLPEGLDRVLLIGRTRPVDRDYLLNTWYDRLRAGRDRKPGRPLILVSTQTVEVGANIDVDALVTESAPWAALVQRLGRLNRLGRPGESPALVVHDPSVGDDDPVYGAARQATWSRLTELTALLPPNTRPSGEVLTGGLDVSPLALRRMDTEMPERDRAAMRPEPPYVPELTEEILDAWTQTSPPPCPDPPVAPFLHGLRRGTPDVAIVWRSGLPDDLAQWADQLHAVPPVAEEALEAPLTAVRRWLAGQQDETVSDLEGQPDTADAVLGDEPVAVRYCGPDRPPVPIRAKDVQPGDLIVVRAERGGCDRYGWNPAAGAPVLDVADLATRRGRPIIRLRPELVDVVREHHRDLEQPIKDLIAMAGDDEIPTAAALRAALPRPEGELPFLRNLQRLAEYGTTACYPDADGRPVIVFSARGGGRQGDEGAVDSSAGAPRRIGLREHERDVAALAEEFARNLGLSEPYSTAVSNAARWHDEGKLDPRFQAMLYQRPLRALGNNAPLAKSGMDPADRAAFRRAQRMAGYPDGMRHEALSARIARAVAGPGNDLVIHLITAHHGRGRPLLPPVHDPEPQRVTAVLEGARVELSTEQTIDWDGPRRFAELNRLHGRWKLALLEAIVRLADIWCSEHGGKEKAK